MPESQATPRLRQRARRTARGCISCQSPCRLHAAPAAGTTKHRGSASGRQRTRGRAYIMRRSGRHRRRIRPNANMPDFVVEFGQDKEPPSDGRLRGPAFARNHAPIWSVMAPFVARHAGHVLEVGSGTGEHVVEYARRSPAVTWWPSDVNPRHLASIAAWRAHAQLANVQAPTRIDLMTADWDADPPV